MFPASFWLYLVSRFGSATAMMMLRAAVAWHVYALSRSAFLLGLIGLVQFVPALALTLVGGALADSYDRRRIMMRAQVVPSTTVVRCRADAEAVKRAMSRAGCAKVIVQEYLPFDAAAAACGQQPDWFNVAPWHGSGPANEVRHYFRSLLDSLFVGGHTDFRM